VSESKYTPGPWKFEDKVDQDGTPFKVIRRCDEDSVYNIAILEDRMPTRTQWTSNAPLIAAAPELLEALIRARALIILLGDQLRTLSGNKIDVNPLLRVDRIDEAIEKARGGQ
jgi:hypothetical protein